MSCNCCVLFWDNVKNHLKQTLMFLPKILIEAVINDRANCDVQNNILDALTVWFKKFGTKSCTKKFCFGNCYKISSKKVPIVSYLVPKKVPIISYVVPN